MSIKVIETTKLLQKAHTNDAAYDLQSATTFKLPNNGEPWFAQTGTRLKLPPGYCALVMPRSGLASKHGITLANSVGLVDAEYTGDITVVLRNNGPADFMVQEGDRIAQLLILALPVVDFAVVENFGETNRGTNGFGSSGISGS